MLNIIPQIGFFSTANLRNNIAVTKFFSRFYFRDATQNTLIYSKL